MPVLQATGIPDIIAAGLAQLGRGRVVDLTTDTQKFYAWSLMTRQGKIDKQSDGHSIQWDLMIDDNGSARAVGLYSQDNINVPNVLKQVSIPWRHIEASYAFDHHEIDMNKGASQIVKIMEIRRYAAMVAMAKFFEDRFWRLPAADDTRNMLGLPYWIVKSNTAVTTNDGFNGGLPSGYSSVAGLSNVDVPRWANYAAQYTNIDVTDLIPKWERAADYTDFTPPVTNPKDFNTGDSYSYCTTYPVYSASKQILRSQNDNLGTDLDPYHDRPTFRRVPITWVKQLDIDTTDPIYGINWGQFKLAVLSNWWMKEFVQDRMPGQHNVTGVFLDSSVNPILRDRRSAFVLAKTTGLPQ